MLFDLIYYPPNYHISDNNSSPFFFWKKILIHKPICLASYSWSSASLEDEATSLVCPVSSSPSVAWLLRLESGWQSWSLTNGRTCFTDKEDVTENWLTWTWLARRSGPVLWSAITDEIRGVPLSRLSPIKCPSTVYSSKDGTHGATWFAGLALSVRGMLSLDCLIALNV